MAKLDMRLLLFVTVLFAVVMDVRTSYAVEYGKLNTVIFALVLSQLNFIS